MGILIDTNVLIRIERNRELPAILEGLPADEPVYIAAITGSELLHGVHRAEGRRQDVRRQFVETVLTSVNVLPFDLEVARVHARLWADLLRRGQLIGAHDLLIAATALTHDFPLATYNLDEFTRVPDLRLL